MRWPFTKRGTEDDGANAPGTAVSAYLDGEVTPAERAQLEREISAQPDLTFTLEALRETKTLIQAMPEEAPRRSFALTPEMVRVAAPEPLRLPERVHTPKRPPFLLYVGQAAAGIGVLGLMLVGASTLFNGSSGSDDGDLASMAANKDGHSTGEIMSTTAGSAADSAGGAPAPSGATAAASGPDAPTAPEISALATSVGGNPSQAPAATCVPGPAGRPICDDTLPIPTAAAADPDTRNSAPAGGSTEEGSSQATEMTAAYDAETGDGDGGPSNRQVAAILFGVLAAAGGGAWLAVAVRRTRDDGDTAG